MRRVVIVLAGIAVLAGGILAAVVIHRVREGRDVHGSSTAEFTVPRRAAGKPGRIPWPTYGFDATRTRAVALALRPPFRRRWTYSAGSLVEFPPAIGYGRLYFSTNTGRVTALNERTGKRAWKYDAHRCAAASPAIGTAKHGTVYAVFMNRRPCNRSPGSPGVDGRVIAFAAGFGRIQWSKKIGPSETSPLLLGNRLYVGDWNGVVWALDAHTGRTVWRFHTHGPIKGSVSASGRRLYVGSYDGNLYCLTRAGRLVWRASGQPRVYGGSQFYSTPAVAYGRVYIGSTDGKVYSFGASTGTLRWSHSTGAYVYASPAVWNGLVFAGSYSHRFYAFDAATGDVRWTFSANGPISGSPTVVGNVVYFATLEKRTYALAARTGKELWSFPDGEYSPVVADKRRLFLIGYEQVYGMAPRPRRGR